MLKTNVQNWCSEMLYDLKKLLLLKCKYASSTCSVQPLPNMLCTLFCHANSGCLNVTCLRAHKNTYYPLKIPYQFKLNLQLIHRSRTLYKFQVVLQAVLCKLCCASCAASCAVLCCKAVPRFSVKVHRVSSDCSRSPAPTQSFIGHGFSFG